MSLDPATERAMIRTMPRLRAYAISLCRNRDRADELVQETWRAPLRTSGPSRKIRISRLAILLKRISAVRSGVEPGGADRRVITAQIRARLHESQQVREACRRENDAYTDTW